MSNVGGSLEWRDHGATRLNASGREAIEQAEDVAIPTSEDGVSVPTRALRAEHVVATSLMVGALVPPTRFSARIAP